MHAILFLFGLGYAPLMYTVFGEHGRDVYYEGPRTLRYWLDLYLPVYRRNRCIKSAAFVSGSVWFSSSLANVEFIFYVLFFVNFLIRRKFGHRFSFDICAILVLAVVFVVVFNLYYEFDRFLDSNVYYLVGIACYYMRKFLTEESIGIKITDRINVMDKKAKTVIAILFCYVWLVVSRIEYHISMMFIWIPLVLDLFPDFRIKKFKMFFDEMKRLNMLIYISNFPFLYEATPRGWPEIVPRDLSTLNSISISTLISWLLTLQHMMLAYPLWFMLRPLENFPTFIRDFKHNCQNA